MIQQPDTSQYDRITQILREQSGQSFNQIDPAMMNAQFSANVMNPPAFLQGLQQAQGAEVENELDILKIFEAKKAAGDRQAKMLDDKIKMFAGDDPQAAAVLLEELYTDQEEIDPSNIYQVMTKLAGIAKRNGIRAASAVKAQSDAGKLAADYQAGLIDDETYNVLRSQVQKPDLTATEQKEIFQQEDIVSAGADSLSILDQMASLNSMPTYEGPAAETRASGASLLGSDEANNTLELANLGQNLAASMLKTTFTGAISNQERQFLQELQATAGKTVEQRQRIIDNGRRLIEARVRRAQERAQRVQGGGYKTSTFAPQPASLGQGSSKYKEGQRAKFPDGSIKVFTSGAWK